MSTEAAPPPTSAPAPSPNGDGLAALATQMFSAPSPVESGGQSDAPVADASPVAEIKETKPANVSEKPSEKKTDAPPATADADPFAIFEPQDGMSEKSKVDFKKFREAATTKVKSIEQELASAKSQLETYRKATPAETAEIERLKQDHKAAIDRLAVFDLKSHPDFVKQYDEPRRNALKEAGEIVAYNNKEGVDLKAILELPQKDFNAKVSELTKDMNGMDATTVQAALRQAHKLTADEKGALSKAGELKQQLESKAAAEARRAFDETRAEIQSKVQLIPVPDDASEERTREITDYNESITRAMADAEKYSFGRMSEREVARMSHEAAMLKPVAQKLIPMLQRDLKSATELNRQLSAELAAIKKSKSAPAFVGGKDAASANSKESLEAMAQRMFSQTS